MFLIVVTKGKHVGNIFPLTKVGPIIIGRGKGCDIRILDLMISRKHCQIEAKNKDFYIKDLESTNKTIVNKRIIKDEVKLTAGDIIKIGNTELLFTDRKEFSIKSVSEYEKFGMKQTMQINLPPKNNS